MGCYWIFQDVSVLQSHTREKRDLSLAHSSGFQDSDFNPSTTTYEVCGSAVHFSRVHRHLLGGCLGGACRWVTSAMISLHKLFSSTRQKGGLRKVMNY